MAAEDPTRVTNPFASTANEDESKEDKPTFVESVEAIACDRCATTVTVLPDPVVVSGKEPAAAVVPNIFSI
jgi:hypothetical protein